MNVQAKLVAALDEGRLVSCKWPKSGDLFISLERHMIDQAMALWAGLDDADRGRRLISVRRAIERATKRLKKNRTNSREMDALASDITLFLAHELVYGDGERWLVKGPGRDTFTRTP